MNPPSADPTADAGPVAAPLPETIGRYRILGRLGAGGMGTVYKAHDPHLDRTVALKVPRIDTPAQDRARRMERFGREARSAAQVWHPHVCPIYDVGEHAGHPYVVMAYVEGQSLAERLARRGRFDDVGEAVTLIGQVLDALGAIHGHGIVHRDVKPSNILLDAGGRAVLSDFGLARPENEAGHLTSEGALVGTPAYMAPEQAGGHSERIGPWTDLYSAGVVFFEMLTGRLPFEGPPLAVLDKVLREPPPPLSTLRPYLDPRLESILFRALAKEPEGRFPSARQFADTLASLAVPVPTVTFAPSPVSREELRLRPGQEETLPRRVLPQGSASRKEFPRTDSRSPDWAKVVLYLLCPACFLVAGACLLIGLLQWGPPGDAYMAAFLLAVIGSIPLVFSGVHQFFSGVHQWMRRKQLVVKNRNGETWLMEAARSGQASTVRNLLARGAEVNDKDEGGQTALMKAAGNGHTAVVRLLLAGGAEVNEKDNKGQTALTKAKDGQHPDIVGLLETAGARE
jgi:hypothetical protein